MADLFVHPHFGKIAQDSVPAVLFAFFEVSATEEFAFEK